MLVFNARAMLSVPICAHVRLQASMLGGALKTTFGKQCKLEDLVEPESLEYYSAIGTNAKVVVLPQLS